MRRMVYKIYMFILRFLPKEFAHKQLFYIKFHKKMDFKNPKTLNEKIQWMICHYYGKNEGNMTDKYLAKEYIKKLNIKNLFIPETFYALKNIKEFDHSKYDQLPEQFVLKTNHGCGNVLICKSKNDFDVNDAIKNLFKQTKSDYVFSNLEYHYSYIKPVVFFEQMLSDQKNSVPIDYKFFCFDGYVDCVMLCTNRNISKKIDFYDKQWNHLDYSKKNIQSDIKQERPKNYDQMIEIASEISKGFPFVRIDLYNIDGRIYFGELTFTPAAGLSGSYSEEGDIHLGSLLDINNIKIKRNK